MLRTMESDQPPEKEPSNATRRGSSLGLLIDCDDPIFEAPRIGLIHSEAKDFPRWVFPSYKVYQRGFSSLTPLSNCTYNSVRKLC